jgi:hypothetical protein
MTLPIKNEPIVVTTTGQDNEVGKFIGRYDPKGGNFEITSLLEYDKIYQIPMYPNQPSGYQFDENHQKKKKR